MKRIMMVLAIFALLLGGVNYAAADVKIGYIDLQKVLNESDSGKVAKEKIAKKVKEYEVQIDRQQKDLKKAKEELEKQALLLSEEARSRKQREYQQKLKELQRFTKDVRDELRMKDNDYTRKILDEIIKVVEKFGAEKGYTAIFEKNESSLVYADEKIDLTDQVIKRYNQSKKK
ncbi:OmpH family outer membrane protein [Geothermobacter hydrogeniphilus]|uniref:Periplasmic chaperone for outer membrane proteins Skp n=1 Tax=Geothermobacter hydrogeniphilus TaxID=1969733 RepID=A0A1X0Y1I1_9BACT|nr:OmpH family outer membrane protein [Geothermobacter hydrogeniphilus]ORJ59055.1 hypothetical protein B5V00_10810 [Geothermobacter hydrogeniphilus]